jgi:hypothetical protein
MEMRCLEHRTNRTTEGTGITGKAPVDRQSYRSLRVGNFVMPFRAFCVARPSGKLPQITDCSLLPPVSIMKG